jgi:release factor glutamine methyltransferase
MTNSKLLVRDLIQRIQISENAEEIESMAYLILESLFGLTRTAVMQEKTIRISADDLSKLEKIASRLNSYEPLQYVLGEAFFYRRIFKVTPAVLIPRPETEHLIEVVKEYASAGGRAFKILDIGTGSGCIPITLSLELDRSDVRGVDISSEALAVAEQNAKALNAKVSFLILNILTQPIPGELDIIVSNPPYIGESEKAFMKPNVLDHEPHLALFVSDNDPLLFYRVISQKGFSALSAGGLLAMEINERFGKEVVKDFERAGFIDVKIIKDLSGKDRVVSGLKPK